MESLHVKFKKADQDKFELTLVNIHFQNVIHIKDTVQCVRLAIETPPARGERVRIMNQMTEVHRVVDLANMLVDMAGAEIDFVKNPRLEAAENDLIVKNDGLLKLGLEPITLQGGLMDEVIDIAKAYVDRVDKDKIPCRSYWRADRAEDETPSAQKEAAAE